MTTPTPFERDLGRTIREKFGATTKVVLFADDERENEVFIVIGENFPQNGVTSYASVGLSKNRQRVGENDLRVEIVAACATATPRIDNLLASCVLDTAKNGSAIVYGSCIKNIVVQYQISDTLRHVTFVAPFLWQGLDKLLVDGEDVYCLMMLPISDAEMRYLEGRGIDALENLFNQHQIDIYDINRPSILA
ncbi:MAG: suppressor of fused domain protein [Achromobacter sp.]|uniref:suppressor of fused domain protein n=1 Tax=Achromobacter sp. TaxID=134375 RepID=UPI0029A473AC|nr:suppressor of fused domain protein [Achromobacter sp.]MDX3989105.1 suppressor of fused domain protein [Achromobacter sp.]